MSNRPTPSSPPSPAPAPYVRKPIPAHEKVPLKEKLAYGFGGLAGGIDAHSEKYILNPIFVLTCGISPAIMSFCAVIYSLWSGVCDMIMGYVSDKTRTRWGRRKPYIFVGAFVTAAWSPLLFLFDQSWPLTWVIAWMVGVTLIATSLMSVWNIPYQCVLLECTTNSTERTNVATWRAYTGTLAGLGMAWLWWLIQRPVFNDITGKPDVIKGAFWVFVGLGVLVLVFGLMPLFVKERAAVSTNNEPVSELSLLENLKLTFQSRAFVILVLFTFLMVVAGAVKSGVEFYTRLNYVFRGDTQLAATLTGIGGTLSTIVGLLGIPLFQYLANRYGKIFAVKLIMAIGFLSSISTIFLYNPEYPYLSLLPGLLVVPGGAAIWVIIPSMKGDCVDEDLLKTGRRRSGSFEATYSWTLRVSTALATLIAGPVVVLVGYDASLKGALQPESVIQNMRIVLAIAPAAIMAAAIWMIHKYPLNDQRIAEIKTEIDRRQAS
jgi:GPH family glycoside/pentoside/hexuronide:cation symporter